MFAPDEAAVMDNTRWICPKTSLQKMVSTGAKHGTKAILCLALQERVLSWDTLTAGLPYPIGMCWALCSWFQCSLYCAVWNKWGRRRNQAMSRPRQSGHTPRYMQYSSYHRNFHLHNSTSCPSASKATSSLNAPQDPSLKRKTLWEVPCTVTSSRYSLPTPTGNAQAVKLN